MKFIVTDSFFNLLKNAFFGVVVVKGLDNQTNRPEVDHLLSASISEAEAYFENRKIKEQPEILPYREAFQALNINPNKFFCSIEALLSRIAKKKGMPLINPVVNLGNAVSLKYRIPLGAHDLETMAGDIEIRPTKEGDTFVPFSESEAEKPDIGEIVYVSGSTVRTRRWTWRQSEHGKITSSTSSIFFPLDGFKGVNEPQVLAARDELAEQLAKIFQCQVMVGAVEIDNPEFELNF